MKIRLKRLGNKGGVYEWVIALAVIFACIIIWFGTTGFVHNFFPNLITSLGIHNEDFGLQYVTTVYDITFPMMIALTLLWALTSPERYEEGIRQQ
jgi:hypothetical protein